jgi:hypothetical protein
MRNGFALPLVFALIFSACGSDSTPTSPSLSSTATLTVSLKDTPFSDAKSLLVTFSAVTAHRTATDFTALPFSGGATSRTCDLKKLTTATDVLGTGAVPAGHYTMLRLVVSSAVLYFDTAAAGAACAPTIAAPAGRSAAVDIPSGEVRLNREFDLTTSKTTSILLDFDGDQSVRQTGNGQYMMTPVIAIVSVQ